MFKCRTCGKTVRPRNGWLRCCGHMEWAKDAEAENRRHSRRVAEEVRQLFDPVIADWNEDDQDFTDYEGIPNT